MLAFPAFIVVMLLFVWIWGMFSSPSDEVIASEAGTACYTAVKQKLKDPGSASIVDNGVIDEGDNTWSVNGSGTARNTFGGMSEFTWECTAIWDDEDEEIRSAIAKVTE